MMSYGGTQMDNASILKSYGLESGAKLRCSAVVVASLESMRHTGNDVVPNAYGMSSVIKLGPELPSMPVWDFHTYQEKARHRQSSGLASHDEVSVEFKSIE